MRWRKIVFSGSDVRQQKPCRKTTTTAPRLLLVFAVLALLCAAGAGTAAADFAEAGTFQELSDAINSTVDERTIAITADIPVGTTSFPAIDAGKSITLTPVDNGDYRIYRTAAGTGNGLFHINGGNLTITDNGTCTLILDGNRSAVTGNTQPLVYVDSNGTFTLAGGEITNNNASYGGGVFVREEGMFTMEGGTIINNNDAAGYAGGVFNDGTFTMEGGTITNNGGRGVYNNDAFTMSGGKITNNNATRDGGGVHVTSDGTFTMSGGEITNNNATRNGGGVSNDGAFTMSGDTKITNNNANYGGGVHNNDAFTMSGGNIANNNASYGGGVCAWAGMFTMSGGKITNNIANNGGGVGVTRTFAMSGGEITNNYAKYGGGVENYGMFTMSGGNIANNIAENVGGGVNNNGGTFMMSDSASVDTTNEVYLWFGTFINVTSPLTGGVHNITHEDITTGTKVVELPAGTGDVYMSNFTLSPAMASYVLEYNDTGVTPIYELAVGSTPTVTPTIPTVTPTIPAATSTTPPTIPPASGDGGNTQNSFRVLFETSGGNTVLPVTGLSYGDRITAPANPIKEGYTFGGWYRNEACTIAWTFADAVPGDITLYAKWNSGAAPTTMVTAAQTTMTAGAAAATQTATMTATTAAATSAESPTATQAPAPVFGILAGLAAAGVLIGRRLTK